jgi:hypothetical protein
MPPKAKKGVDDVPAIVPRPTSANDRDIFASVKQLQGLINTEVKWKNRVSSAKQISQVSRLKELKLNRLIEVCDEGAASLQTQLQDFFSALADIGYCNAPVNVSSAGHITRAGALSIPVAAAPPTGGQGAAGKGAPAAAPVEDIVSADAQVRRKEQLDQLTQFIRAVYQQPRLSRERPPARPQNPIEMQREFDLAAKLGSPSSIVPETGAAAAAKPGAKAPPPALRPPKAPKPSESNAASGVDPYLGELPPADFFVLPMPKGFDPAIMQYVFLLRSKKLRLEHCKALFISELEPLGKRISCNHSVNVVSGYSLEALAPQIRDTAALEANLQKIRQAEDQAFLAKRAQSVPPSSAGKR